MIRTLLVGILIGAALAAGVVWLFMPAWRSLPPTVKAAQPEPSPVFPDPEGAPVLPVQPKIALVGTAPARAESTSDSKPSPRLSPDDLALVGRVARLLHRDPSDLMDSLRPGVDFSDVRATYDREYAKLAPIKQMQWERAAEIKKQREKSGNNVEIDYLSDSKDRGERQHDEARGQPRSSDEFVISGVDRDEGSGRVRRTIVRILPGQDPEFDRLTREYETAAQSAADAVWASLARCQR